ncbi:MAG: YbhB/YbcL family Raf kinase inhibitor-like protein [Candidatus Woesearchaeota archaeon]
MDDLIISSPAFENNGEIPSKYTCDGDDVNPPLDIEGIPDGTKELVLIVDDPDAPVGNWDHWVVINIPPDLSTIEENSVPGTELKNDFKKTSWGGPCPPGGTHRYFFKVYALDIELNLGASSDKKDVESEMEEHILAKGELIGVYSRR